MTYWISLAGFTFSLEARGGVIFRASATARWAVGRDAVVALDFYRRQGASIDWINYED